MRGTVTLSKEKLYTIINLIEATEKTLRPVEAIEISFGQTLSSGIPADWIKTIMQTSDEQVKKYE